MILAASLTGTEYGWGTVRTVLTRGAGRWQLLASKLLLVALLGVGALIVGALSMALSSFIASLTLEGGTWLAESAEWVEVARTFGKAIFGLLPYVALGLFFAVLTTSSGTAIGLALGYAVAEGIVISILANFDWFERFSGYILGQAVGGWLGTTGGELFVGGGDDGFGDAAVIGMQPEALQGFLVSLAYIVVLSGLAFWLFQRRDIAGAKGE